MFPIFVVIDAFRAATTATAVLARRPRLYLYTHSCAVAARLAASAEDPLLIGRPEPGSTFRYHLPNSPSRVSEHQIADRVVIHRTSAGAIGVLQSPPGAEVLLAGFVNAEATAERLRDRPHVLLPMGHEATTPSLEDELCARLIAARVVGSDLDLGPHLADLRAGPGRYFFEADPRFYPPADFELCLAVDTVHFSVRVHRRGDHSLLQRA